MCIQRMRYQTVFLKFTFVTVCKGRGQISVYSCILLVLIAILAHLCTHQHYSNECFFCFISIYDHGLVLSSYQLIHKDIINDSLVINPARKKNGGLPCEQLQSRTCFLLSHVQEVKDRKKSHRPVHLKGVCRKKYRDGRT